jgi:hypothetical protein
MTLNLALSAWRFWVCWALDAQCQGLDAQQGRNGWSRSHRVSAEPLPELLLRTARPSCSPELLPQRYSSDLSAPWAGCGSAA